jgi:hypothetical protein
MLLTIAAYYHQDRGYQENLVLNPVEGTTLSRDLGALKLRSQGAHSG